MASLPPLSEVLSSDGTPESALTQALSTLFEPSPMIVERLSPELAALPPRSVETYAALLDLALATIAASWDLQAKAVFVGAHPRIGEAARNLSHLSWQEQGRASDHDRSQEKAQRASLATPSPELLDRLALLNLAYEKRYPGLKYITFVNGRPLTVIKDELEAKLNGSYGDDAAGQQVKSLEISGPEWCVELERNIGEMGKIAKDRLRKLGVE